MLGLLWNFGLISPSRQVIGLNLQNSRAQSSGRAQSNGRAQSSQFGLRFSRVITVTWSGFGCLTRNILA